MRPRRLLAAVLLALVLSPLNEFRAEEPTIASAPPAPFAADQFVTAQPKAAKINTMKPGPGPYSRFQETYGVVCGDNQLVLQGRNLFAHELTIGGQAQPVEIVYWGSTAAGWGHPFKGGEPAVTLDPAANRLTVTKKFAATSAPEADGSVCEKISVLADGLVDFDYRYTVPPSVKVDGCLQLNFRPYSLAAGMKIQVDDQSFQISPAGPPYGENPVFRGRAGRLVFHPGNPARTFAVILPRPLEVWITEKKPQAEASDKWKYFVEVRINPEADGALCFQLDMRTTSAESLNSADTFAGINFWKNDRLHVPDFAASRNLLPNPSFEADLHHYTIGPYLWGEWPGADRQIYAVDDTVAHSGRRSLRATTWKDYPRPSALGTFTIPTLPGKKYTFSFYAKADDPRQWIEVACVTGEWLKFPPLSGFQPTLEWTRYAGTFTAPNSAAILVFRPRHNGGTAESAHVWLDSLQLEAAEAASEYIGPPVNTWLECSAPGNYLAPGQPPAARLRISTASPASQVALTCAVEDYFYRMLWQGEFKLTTDQQGEATLALPLEGKLGTGVFVLSAKCVLAEGASATDFHRLSIMKPLTENFRHRPLFSAPGIRNGSFTESYVRHLWELGLGSISYEPAEEKIHLIKKYGLIDSGCSVLSYYTGARGAKDAKYKKARDELAARVKVESYSDGLRDDIARFTGELVRACPWIDQWFLFHESNPRDFKVLAERDAAGFAQFLIATYRAVKQADPAKTALLDGGPCNMFPNGGIRDIDEWLTQADRLAPDVRFDGFAIHPYRQLPEAPDLDADAAAFFNVLDKHGYLNAPAFWNEGIYYTPLNVPEWGLDPHKGCSTDHWWAGTPTYHMGWGERISAAYTARSWLVALKYGARVRQFTAWGLNLTIDSAMVPMTAVAKVPNTLGHLLGDADFKRDLRFAVNCRAYVFVDGQGRPVAALWSHIPEVDRGRFPSPVAQLRLPGLNPEFIDLMENAITPASPAEGSFAVPVTPFPVFIRTRPGSLAELCQGIAAATLSGSREFPLAVGLELKSRTTAELTFTNRISRRFEGSAKIGARELPLSIAEAGTATWPVTLPAPIPFDEIAGVALPLTVTENGGASVSQDFSLRAVAVAETRDWESAPWLKLTNRRIYKTRGGTSAAPVQVDAGYPGDLEAEYKLRWDRNKLRLLVKVRDDRPCFPQGENQGGDWRFDSLQIYLDAYGDNANRQSQTIFDFNDYSYLVSRDAASGRARVYRENAPEQQLAGGIDAPKPHSVDTEAEAEVKLLPDGYLYEIAFPARIVAPLKLQAGTFARLGLTLNDNDGEGRKGCLVNTAAPDSEPYTHPEQWPGIILTEAAP